MSKRYIVRWTVRDSDFDHHIYAPDYTIEQWREEMGEFRYIKLGGGTTRDITEANVIGWKDNDRWLRKGYELIEVSIVPGKN